MTTKTICGPKCRCQKCYQMPGCGPMVQATLKQMVFEIGTLRLELIEAQESEAVWKTEADKADQRRLEAEAEVERLEAQLKRAIEIAEKIWADCSNGSEHTELAELKGEIK